MQKTGLTKFAWLLLGLPVAALLIYQIPSVNSRLSWRTDVALTYLRGVIHPVGGVPTALPQPAVAVTLYPTKTPAVGENTPPPATPSPGPTATSTATPTPLPAAVSLPPPA